VSFDGQAVEEMTDVLYRVGKKEVGDSASLVLDRDGVETTAAITFFRFTEKKAH